MIAPSLYVFNFKARQISLFRKKIVRFSLFGPKMAVVSLVIDLVAGADTGGDFTLVAPRGLPRGCFSTP